MSTKKDKFSKKDKFYMDLALDLARSREGLTGTNPSVGCVIVKNNKIISSTIIRKKIRAGKMEEINKLLNRVWSVEGKVIKGQKRGRKIGFPTCNLKLGRWSPPRSG